MNALNSLSVFLKHKRVLSASPEKAGASRILVNTRNATFVPALRGQIGKVTAGLPGGEPSPYFPETALIPVGAASLQGGAIMKKINRCGMRSQTRFYFGLLFGFFLLLTTAAYAAKPTNPPDEEPPAGDSIDLGGGFVEHMGFIPAGDNGVGFTNETIRHMGVSIGQLGGINPETGEVIFNDDNLLPLVARELDIIGNAYFNTNIYIAGDTVVYGDIYGSGAGISNIPAANITGSLAERPELQTALDSKLDSDEGGMAISGNTAGISNLQQAVSILSSAVPSWNAAYTWGNHALEGYTRYEELMAQTTATNNPHNVNAEQLGVLPVSGGSMSGHIDMSGVARITNLPDPANEMDAVSKRYLEKRLSFIPPQGDISMGIYTNFAGY